MFEENGTIVGRSACVRPVSHVNGARIDGGPDRGQSRRCEADEDSSAGRDDVVVTPEPPGLMLGIVQNGPTQMVSGNIYESLPAPSPVVTLEDVLRRNPDIILVTPIERGNILRSDRWRVLPAVRNGRVLAYDTNRVSRPSVKLGEAAVSLARLFHPGLLP